MKNRLIFLSCYKVINLVGPASQQDVEMSAIFKDAVNTYGSGKVLGILATKSDDHDIRKREAIASTQAATEEPSTTTTTTTTGTPVNPTEEPMEENFVYIDEGKTMMYTTSPPFLSDNDTVTELRYHGLVTTDERKDEFVRFIVSFKVNRTEVTKVNWNGDHAVNGIINSNLYRFLVNTKIPFSNCKWILVINICRAGRTNT